MAITALKQFDFEQVTAEQVQTQFGKIADIVKGNKPMAITQNGKPTMVLFSYEDAVEAKRILAAKALLAWLDRRAKNPPESLQELTLEELDRMIDEERSKL